MATLEWEIMKNGIDHKTKRREIKEKARQDANREGEGEGMRGVGKGGRGKIRRRWEIRGALGGAGGESRDGRDKVRRGMRC